MITFINIKLMNPINKTKEKHKKKLTGIAGKSAAALRKQQLPSCAVAPVMRTSPRLLLLLRRNFRN